MYGDLIPYQIGDARGAHHIFTKPESVLTMPMPLKTNIANYPIGHGNVDLRLNRPDYFDDWIVDIQFMLWDKDESTKRGFDYNNQDICLVRYILHSYDCKIFPIFFKRELDGGRFIWLVNYAHPVADGMPEQENSEIDDNGLFMEKWNMRLRLIRPYFVEIDDGDLRFFEKEKLSDQNYLITPGECYPEGYCFDTTYTITKPTLEATDEENSFFCSCDGTGPGLVWYDKLMSRSDFGINTNSNYYEYLISGLAFEKTIFDFDYESSANGLLAYYMIEFGPLEQGQEITLLNATNGSEITFTWSNPVTSPTIIYNSFDSTFFDTNGNNLESSITYKTNGSELDLFYASNTINNSPLQCKKQNEICFTKNFDGDTNVNIKIYNTYLT